jgi:hypothetical protein
MEFVNSLITPNDSGAQDSSPKYCLPLPDFYETSVTSTTSTIGRLAKITDFTPEWDYLEGGNKILILGPDFHSGLNYFCMFDQVEVPAELVQVF